MASAINQSDHVINRNGLIYKYVKPQVMMLFTFNISQSTSSQTLHQWIVHTCTTLLWSVDLTASDITSPEGFQIHLLQELRLFWSLSCLTLVYFGETKWCSSSPYDRSLHLQWRLACSLSLFHNLWRVSFFLLFLFDQESMQHRGRLVVLSCAEQDRAFIATLCW